MIISSYFEQQHTKKTFQDRSLYGGLCTNETTDGVTEVDWQSNILPCGPVSWWTVGEYCNIGTRKNIIFYLIQLLMACLAGCTSVCKAVNLTWVHSITVTQLKLPKGLT